MLSFTSAAAFSVPSPLLGAVSLTAEPVFGPVTNSIVMAVIVCAVIIWFVRGAMKNPQLVPDGRQNFVELVVEFLFTQTEAIVGKKVAPRAFPLLATIFVFVLVNNYFGLLPGVGTIGWHAEHHGEHAVAAQVAHVATGDTGHGDAAGHADTGHGEHAAQGADHGKTSAHGEEEEHKAHLTPWFRPGTADLNFTLALACVFMIVWMFLTIRELGLWGFVLHTFGPKGGLTGFMKYALVPIFFFVGLIELVSIAFRPVSLSLRLFGNIFAGETLLHAMGALLGSLGAPKWLDFVGKILLPLPFYFLELLVGLLQATVFTLLCAVYIQLSTTHEDHGDGHHDETGPDGHPASH
jgi:F-type H+-transporting ATPase subunit a